MTLWISRDWARDGVYAAEIGHDSDNHPHPWVVRVSRTASGRPAERTDDPMITLSVRHFADSTDAGSWCECNGFPWQNQSHHRGHTAQTCPWTGGTPARPSVSLVKPGK